MITDFSPSVFPLFWLLGSFILLNNLSEPSEWRSTKSALERATLMRTLRTAERKWARRCLCAWLILCLAVLATVLGALAIMKWT
jgi:hypothetical protein